MSGAHRPTPPIRTTLRVVVPLLAGALAACPLSAQDTRLLIVVGLAGEDRYQERFHGWASTIREAAVGRLGLPESNVTWLAGNPAADADRIQGRSTTANVQATLAEIAERASPSDRVLVVLIGHGTSRDGEGRFNLPGPDLSPDELDLMLDRLAPRPVAVVHTASASGDFVAALAAKGRTVITATRSGRENTETWFAGFFADALAGDGSDLDKDGRISLLEAFEFARRGVARYFEERNLLVTEHAVLDDDGDGRGTMEPADSTSDGRLAGAFFVGGPPLASSASRSSTDTDDPVLQRLYEERLDLEQRISVLRARRDELETATYEQQFEELLVDLALKNREVREREGGE